MTPQITSTFMQFAPLVLIFGVFYLLILRPQQTKQKQLRANIANLKRGDRVVTAGGMIATVARTKDGAREIELDIAANTRVTVLRDTISAVLAPDIAND